MNNEDFEKRLRRLEERYLAVFVIQKSVIGVLEKENILSRKHVMEEARSIIRDAEDEYGERK
jgi:hypothetical protein